MKKSLALLAVLLLAGCASVQPDPHAADAGEGTENYESLDLGTPQTIQGITVTVNSLTPIKGDLDMLHTAKSLPEGDQYAKVSLSVENGTDQSTEATGYVNFKIVNAENEQCSFVLGAELEGNLEERLGAGEKLSGELAYEIPMSGELILQYYPNTLSDEFISFRIR